MSKGRSTRPPIVNRDPYFRKARSRFSKIGSLDLEIQGKQERVEIETPLATLVFQPPIFCGPTRGWGRGRAAAWLLQLSRGLAAVQGARMRCALCI